MFRKCFWCSSRIISDHSSGGRIDRQLVNSTLTHRKHRLVRPLPLEPIIQRLLTFHNTVRLGQSPRKVCAQFPFISVCLISLQVQALPAVSLGILAIWQVPTPRPLNQHMARFCPRLEATVVASLHQEGCTNNLHLHSGIVTMGTRDDYCLSEWLFVPNQTSF